VPASEAEAQAIAVAEQGSANGASGDGAESAEAPVQAVAAEFEVEVEGEVFRVRVAGAGVAVVPVAVMAGAMPATSGAPAPRAARAGAITAPMQGLIVKVPVKVGDEVKLGDVVAVLEAMKMQNDIVATQPGRVTDVYVKEGEVVSPNQPLVAVS
jgi:biotin carboxyl carrier protein